MQLRYSREQRVWQSMSLMRGHQHGLNNTGSISGLLDIANEKLEGRDACAARCQKNQKPALRNRQRAAAFTARPPCNKQSAPRESRRSPHRQPVSASGSV